MGGVAVIQLRVDVNSVDFGTAVVDETLTRSILLTNDGARPANFTFDRLLPR